MKKKYIISMILLVLTCIFVQPTFAEDAKTLSGSACKPLDSNAEVIIDLWGRMYNDSTSPQDWSCIFPRDVMAAATEGIAYGNVKFIDNNPTASGWCYLLSEPSTGYTGHGAYRETTVAQASSSPVTLSYPSLYAYSWGFYHYWCKIPGKYGTQRSGIVSYSITEN